MTTVSIILAAIFGPLLVGAAVVFWVVRATFGPATVPNPDQPNGWIVTTAKKLNNQTILVIAGIGILFMFWGGIADWLVSFYATSDAGQALPVESDWLRKWLWFILPLAAWMIYKFIKPRKFNATSHHVPFADNVAIVGLVVFVLAIVGLVTAWTTDIDDVYLGTQEQPTFGSITCGQERLEQLQYTRRMTPLRTIIDGLNNNSMELKRIPNALPGVRINICPGDTRLEWLFSEPGGQLEITYTSGFRSDNPDIVNQFPPSAFIQPQAGAVVDAWYLFIPPSNRSTGFVSPFELGIEHVEVNIRTVYP